MKEGKEGLPGPLRFDDHRERGDVNRMEGKRRPAGPPSKRGSGGVEGFDCVERNAIAWV